MSNRYETYQTVFLSESLGLIPWGGHRYWGTGQFVLEYGHVAYRNKADDACNNMVANI